MKLYDDIGYLDFNTIYHKCETLTMIIGARGIGKTYGAIKFCLDNDISFAYMRRTQTQLDLLKSKDPKLNVFYAINGDTDYDLSFKKLNRQAYGIYARDEENARGFGIALSTFSNMRSFGAGIDLLLYDEFIAQDNERPLHREAESFYNVIESINRNRELKGEKPIKIWCLANSNDVGTPLLLSLNLVNRAITMQDRKIEIYTDTRRHLSLLLPVKSPIAENKKHTFLYELTKGTSFHDMAISNKFSYNDLNDIESKDLKDFKPLCVAGEICVYKQRNGKGYYISSYINGAVKRQYRSDDMDITRFTRHFNFLQRAYMNNRLTFENYNVKVIFENYFKMR